MNHLDNQMQRWSTRLRDDLKIEPPVSNRLATTIGEEIAALPVEVRQRISNSSRISLNTRLEELSGFQGWMDLVDKLDLQHPAIIRAQVVYQNYLCFVYLGDSCFNVLKRALPSGSAGRKCCRFLTENPIRAFRNAVAHANWQYLPDFSGLQYWARKGADPNEPMSKFVVSQQDLNFWQALARCTAYASFMALED